MTVAVSPVLTTKYGVASAASERTIDAEGTGAWNSGPEPVTRKNSFPANQIDSPRFPKLNIVWTRLFLYAAEMRNPSRASVTAPTSGPNSMIEARPNTSPSETRESTPGIVMVSQPQTTVRIENKTHSIGTVPRIRATAL